MPKSCSVARVLDPQCDLALSFSKGYGHRTRVSSCSLKNAVAILGGVQRLVSVLSLMGLTGASSRLLHDDDLSVALAPQPVLAGEAWQDCRIDGFQPENSFISSSSRCFNSTFSGSVFIGDHADISNTQFNSDADIGIGAQVLNSNFFETARVGQDAVLSGVYAFGDFNAEEGVHWIALDEASEFQGNTFLGAGLSRSDMRMNLDSVSVLFDNADLALRVFPGALNVTQGPQGLLLETDIVTSALDNVTPKTLGYRSIDEASNDDASINQSDSLDVVGEMPKWVLQEGEVSIFEFAPADVIQSREKQVVNYRMLGAYGEQVNWVFLDIERGRVVFNPISGLLGDDATLESFDLTLRAIDEFGLFREANTSVEIVRVTDGCEFLPEVVKGSLDPIGGISRYVKCQGSESAQQPDQRLVLLEALGKTLAVVGAVALAVTGALTASALVRDLVKSRRQPDIDSTLTRILGHIDQQPIFTASEDWDKKVLDIFKDLHVFPNHRGALRHVAQYRNDVFKILGYALPNLRGTNQQFAGKLLREYLPIRQRLQYGCISNTVGWLGMDGSTEDLRNVIYALNHMLTAVRYSNPFVAEGPEAVITDDPFSIDDINQRLANRITLLNLPFLASKKVSHFWPVDAVTSEMRLWRGGVYRALHCNLSRRIESKEMEVLAGSDMARLLNVLVPEAKRRSPYLETLFSSQATQVALQLHEFTNTQNLTADQLRRVGREMMLNFRVSALMHMILDHELDPAKFTIEQCKEPVKLNLIKRFNQPVDLESHKVVLPDSVSCRHIELARLPTFNEPDTDVLIEVDEAESATSSLSYVTAPSIVVNNTETASGHWFELMEVLNRTLIADGIDINKVATAILKADADSRSESEDS